TALASRTRPAALPLQRCRSSAVAPPKIALHKFCDPESRLSDQAIDVTIEVPAASNAPPDRGDPILPNCDTPVWGSAVFKKDHSPVGLSRLARLDREPARHSGSNRESVTESLQRFPRFIQEPPVGIKGKIHIDEDIGVSHKRRPEQSSQ